MENREEAGQGPVRMWKVGFMGLKGDDFISVAHRSQTHIFLANNVSAVTPVLNTINQVYIFIMLSTVQSLATLSHVLSHLRIAITCVVGDIPILQIRKLTLREVVGFTGVTQLLSCKPGIHTRTSESVVSFTVAETNS